jgi:hypothetical protein
MPPHTAVEGGLITMTLESELEEIHRRIRDLRHAAERVRTAGDRIPAVERNARRILGGIDMLERNICDLFDPESPWEA